MELCVGGESIPAADTHMGMSRAVCYGPDWSGLAKEPRPATHSPRAGAGLCVSIGKARGLKRVLLTASSLNAHDHMDKDHFMPSVSQKSTV